MQSQPYIGLTHLAYRLPSEHSSLDELERAGLLTSSAAFLEDLGFAHCHTCADPNSFDDLIAECAQQVLSESGLSGDEIRWLFKYSGLENNGFASPAGEDVLRHFRYPVAKIHHRLDLPNAAGVAVGQQGCSGLLSTIEIAAQMLRSSDDGAVLCLAGDSLPAGANREVLYNVMSDACAAVLIQRDPIKNRIIHFHQHTVPYFWDTPQHKEELLSSYFPLAQRVIETTLDQVGIPIGDVDWFVPHNVNARSWTILSDLIGVSEEKVWMKNVAGVGHTVCCDHIINLRDMETQGILERGNILVLFTFGFGANWSCMIVEH